mmetsp:Transcript_27913/g.90058  ORF Transcript_27913/g.90058 Transcript_27913/m.90058 type:complete len:214 (-) Transcript_27913:279-920(-)
MELKSCPPSPCVTMVSYSANAAAPIGMGAPCAFPASSARPISFRIRAVPNPPVYPRDEGTPSITPGYGLYVSELQQRPEDTFTMSARTLGSAPSLPPRFMASETAAMLMPRMRLLQSLATSPVPTSPQWKMFLPMCSRRGLARAKFSSLPPTMNVSVPACAPPTPPDTGASTKLVFLSAATEATLRDTAGSMVEQSINSVPGCAVDRTPSSPR